MTDNGSSPQDEYCTVVEQEISPTPSRSKAILLLAGFCTTIIVAIVLATGVLVAHFRDRAFAESGRELRNTALILAKQIEGSFQTFELVNNSIAEHVLSAGITSAAAFDTGMADAAAHMMLKDKMSGLTPLEALVLVNANGDVINSSRAWPMPKINISDRRFFITLKSDSQLVSILSEPFRSRFSGSWTIALARKLSSPDGQIIGFALASVQLPYFEQLFASIALRDESAISLVSAEGLLLARFPADDHAVAQPLSISPEALMQDGDSAITRLTRKSDTTDRLAAFQRVAHYPVFITAGTSVDSILTDWRGQWKILLGLRIIAAAFVVLAAFLIARQVMGGIRAANGLLSRQTFRLNTALSNMSQGLLMTDADGQIILCNNRYLQMYKMPADMVKRGCTRREILEHHFSTNVLSGSLEKYESEIVGEISTHASYSKTVQTSDGRTIAIVNRAIEGGMRVSTHEDVTEARRTEEERDRSRDFLDCVLENVPATIVVKDARDLRYVLANRSAELLWGVSREEVIGRTAHDIFAKPTADAITQIDRQLLEDSSAPILSQQHPIDTPRNGRRIVTTKRLCVRKEHGDPQYLIHVIEDVTDHVALEDQLRHSQRMESVGSLTGGLAHDFNNLLTTIIGNLELMQNDFPDASDQIAEILKASEQGAELTRQLLAFARKQPLQPKPVDINGLVRTTARFFTPALGETISLDLRMIPGLQTAVADQAQLQTAVLNIVLNARDAMPDGGMLTIETRNVELDVEYAARHSEVSAGKYVLVEISDNGCGMERDVLDRIFEPFFTTKPVGRGTGLGLSMVYGFMKQSGGHVSVYSEVGKGTTFKLYLPVFEGAMEESAAPGTTISEPSRIKGGAVILAVEDNTDVRTTVVRQLKDLGYVVREADSAHAAWRILDEDHTIDLLFTDIIMPGNINGKELAVFAKQRHPHLKVLFTSGFPGGSLANGELLDEGDLLLSKPYRKRELEELVGRALTH
jgi:PAS domain S-box-containing protein